jgi:hypothetical protein
MQDRNEAPGDVTKSLEAQIAELREEAHALEILNNVSVAMAAELPQGGDIKLPRLGKPYQPDQLAAEIVRVIKAGVPA